MSSTAPQPYLFLKYLLAVAAPLALVACSGGTSVETPPPEKIACVVTPETPAGLSQPRADAPIFYVAGKWNIRVCDGEVKIAGQSGLNTPYTAEYSTNGAQEYVNRTSDPSGRETLGGWVTNRRTIILPGDIKVTMQAADGHLTRIAVHEGPTRHEIDVAQQTIIGSTAGAAATQTEAAEADGDTAQFTTYALLLVNLYQENAAPDATPLPREKALRILKTASEQPDPFEQPADGTLCPYYETPITTPAGTMEQAVATGPLTYRTVNGETVIKIDLHKITTTLQCRNTWEVWGDPHENLNGKHMKDWLDPGLRRTLLLPDGVKITMHADGPHHVVHTTSIYDGAHCYQIDNNTNILTHTCIDGTDAAQREADEYDGETAVMDLLATEVAAVVNVYDQQPGAPGEPDQIQYDAFDLGTTGGKNNPKQVNDWFDDKRLPST